MNRHRLLARPAVLIIVLFYTLLALAGCGTAQAAPTPSALPNPIPSTPSSTATQTAQPPPPSATVTSAPSATATLEPTAAPSQTPSPSATATAQAAFDKAKVTAVRNQVGGVMVTIRVPNLKEVYNVILAGVSYTCDLDPKYPDLLFCWGLAGPPYNKYINLTFLDPSSGAIVLEEKTYLSEADFAPPGTMTDNSANCANKGQNQSCEVECRIDDNGNPCIVASCFDGCGQTLSIQTCSSNLSNISFCTADQMNEIKKRYNLP
jgi:hypothetical protein